MLAMGGAAATTACFVAGTPVLLDTGMMIPIEDVRLGQVVASAPDPLLRGVREEACLDGVSWREVHLQIDRPDGATTDAYLLRPDEWLDSVGATTGNVIMIDLPEMAIHGPACVLEISPCPEILGQTDTGKSIVTGRFVTSNAAVLDLFLDGDEEPIGTTAAHPFWSLDREGWVRAGDLSVGEGVATLDGSAIVAAAIPEQLASTVYNLEVRGDHTYYVSDAKLWVHNAYIGPFPRSTPGWTVSLFDQKEWITKMIWDMRRAGGASDAVIRDFVVGTLQSANLTKQTYTALVQHLDHLLGL